MFSLKQAGHNNYCNSVTLIVILRNVRVFFNLKPTWYVSNLPSSQIFSSSDLIIDSKNEASHGI